MTTSDLFALLERLRDWRNLLDMALVAAVIYGLLRLFRGTQAVQVLRGLVFIGVVMAILNQIQQLTAFRWLLTTVTPFLAVAIPVIFQPELRRALERVGRSAPLLMRRVDNANIQHIINEVVKAVDQMAQKHQGALIVFEGSTGLSEISDRGVAVDATISNELILTIFFPNTALHDGATIIRGDRVLAASCVLPLTQREALDTQMGTRHRAALGMTEQTDALVIVVSEETGAISAVRNGRMVRVDPHRLRTILTEFYLPK